MNSLEFEAVTALEKVRAMKSLIEQLDPAAGTLISDPEHAAMRRTLRAWEQKLMKRVTIRNRAAKETISGALLQIELQEPKLREVKP